MRHRVNRLRWHLARWIAPDHIVAAPSGDAKAYIYMRDERWSTWIETSSIQVDMANRFVPILGDDFALSTMAGPSGTFQGTIGEPA